MNELNQTHRYNELTQTRLKSQTVPSTAIFIVIQAKYKQKECQ